VEVPGTNGLIVCPGKDEYAGLGIPTGPWKRDLDLDLQVIRDWGAGDLVSLIEGHEFNLLGVPDLPAKVRSFAVDGKF
jgi:ADP-ribosyl-[dinitrogen reductase] hydrolase